MLFLLLAGHIGITYFIWKWLLPGQLASAISNWYLFVLCFFWPVWVALIVGLEIYSIIRYWGWKPDDYLQKWDDVKPADPGPRKKR